MVDMVSGDSMASIVYRSTDNTISALFRDADCGHIAKASRVLATWPAMHKFCVVDEPCR